MDSSLFHALPRDVVSMGIAQFMNLRDFQQLKSTGKEQRGDLLETTRHPCTACHEMSPWVELCPFCEENQECERCFPPQGCSGCGRRSCTACFNTELGVERCGTCDLWACSDCTSYIVCKGPCERLLCTRATCAGGDFECSVCDETMCRDCTNAPGSILHCMTCDRGMCAGCWDEHLKRFH